MTGSYDENTMKEFVAENRDHLEEIEPDLLALEQQGGETPPEIVNRVFRAIHSIKGSSGFFSFSAIKELSHVMENVLMGIRDGWIPPGTAGIDALLAGVDKLRIMFVDVEKSDKVPYTEELDRLNGILRDTGAGKPSLRANLEALPGPWPQIEEMTPVLNSDGTLTLECLDGMNPGTASFDLSASRHFFDALKSGAYLYALRHSDQDSSNDDQTIQDVMGQYGESIPESGPHDGPTPRISLFATVMEEDLLCEVLGIPSSRIRSLDAGILNDLLAPVGEPEPAGPPNVSGPFHEKPHEPDPHVSPAREETGGAYETIRVRVDIIDALMNLAGELVLGRNQLRQELDQTMLNDPKLGALIQGVDMVTSEVQEKIMQMRMQSVGNLFTKFTRVMRDLSRQLNKDVDLVLEGREVELDRSILEGLSDPMIHLLRNSLDHGIEETGARKNSGKPLKGTIRLRAFHEGGQVNITVTDDGRGIDPDLVVKKAIARNMISAEAATRMGDKEKMSLILLPGFSTAEEVSEISGRGVGMDVVRTNIQKLGGHLEIDSQKGKCTTIRIRLPLTLAIIPSLIVGAGGHRFAIPQVNVKELVCIRAEDVTRRIEQVADAEVLRLRDALLPIVRLTDALGLPRTFVDLFTGEDKPDRRGALLDRRSTHAPSPAGEEETPRERERRARRDRRQSWHSDLYVVVLRLGDNRFGLCVDELFDTEEIVVKPLSSHIKDVKCFSGATIMGDGKVAMILDAAGIAAFTQLRFSEIGAEERRRREEDAARREAESINRRSVLLFNSAPEESFALPLDSVSRLERVDPERIHHVGPHEFMDYRGVGLPLLRLERCLPVAPLPCNLDEMFVIIPKTRRSPAGILVSRILDTTEASLPDRHERGHQEGLLGSFFLNGRLTLFLDAEELLSLHEKERAESRFSDKVDSL